MIIDYHAHVFQNWHGPCGHASNLRKYCGCLSASEKDAVLGGNVAHLFGLNT